MSSLNEEVVHLPEEVTTKNWYDSTPEAEVPELPQCNETILPSRRLILAGIENTHHLAQLEQEDIEKILEISQQEAATLRSIFKCIEAPITPITGLEALKASKTITTGCLAIDQLFSFTPVGTRGTKRTYSSQGEHGLVKDGGSKSQPPVSSTEKAGIPLGSITEISGVSGSGKSTFWLVFL
ncbi:hypothetical protein DSO57_1015776 [Entomophthora muscae]|uniref:Uncharacterized protein n=1 Tax=Entomophthora muscae TaxID=34485 RepID=A0ACC2T558_9FUNG|nr:hypothetical protein DSO57_1015776 [Entomophthora muscae]